MAGLKFKVRRPSIKLPCSSLLNPSPPSLFLTLPYRSGMTRETPEGIEHITMVKMCRKGDPEFFDALEDALPKYSLLGKRIEGVLLTEEREETRVFQPLITPAYAVREESEEYETE
jgi:hypothetical protein